MYNRYSTNYSISHNISVVLDSQNIHLAVAYGTRLVLAVIQLRAGLFPCSFYYGNYRLSKQ